MLSVNGGGVKAEWTSSYINRKEKAGFSVNKIVTAKDEWCAEAYMETDYSKLSREDFVFSIKQFVYTNELFLKNE